MNVLCVLLKYISFSLFTLSTPLAVIMYDRTNNDRMYWSIVNSYGFSVGMIGIYMYPFFSFQHSFWQRLNQATMNWIVYLTVFTEVVFQVPHSLFVSFLYENNDSVFAWPFRSYGVSDSRWNEFHPQPSYVAMINFNDAGLGILVGITLVLMLANDYSKRSRVLFILTVLFRDATLWRETIEYMYDHHKLSYVHSTSDPSYRRHAIVCLWFVNILWIVAPCLTFLWAYNQLCRIMATTTQTMKKKSA